MPPSTLILRADANIAMGTGHLMRCLALAQAFQDKAGQDQGGPCIFTMAEGTAAAEERIRREKFEVVNLAESTGPPQDAAQVIELARARQAAWVVLDGYQFDIEYQRRLKAVGMKLLVVDDTGHAGAYAADLVLDQNVHATEDSYARRESYCQLLLGPRYALLRREFKPWRNWKREIAPVARKVLVTVGGSDPDNVTFRIICALRLLAEHNLEATVVVGGSNPHANSLEREVESGGDALRLVRDVPDMPKLMAEADVAISAAGITTWEMCFLGLPAVLIDVAENQTPGARELDRQGIAIHAGSSQAATPESIAARLKPLLVSPECRAAMSERGRKLVDGLGAERVVSAMRGGMLVLRRVEEADCLLLWEWANESEVRSASFSSMPIAWDEHRDWFTKKLGDERVLMLIASDEQGVPLGQVRFEPLNDGEAEIDVSVAPEKRGTGWGARLIEKAVQAAFEQTDLVRVHGFVKVGNRASARAFERADFRNVGTAQVKGCDALHYQRNRNGKLR
jgi:UDP-2,4-diacetamido-2,4,6-trideoxy-beta-L-altropyranose hydrolase